MVLHKAELPGNEIVKLVAESKNVLKSATGVKGEFAATVVEFDHKEGPHVCAREAVSQLPGVIRVRVIK